MTITQAHTKQSELAIRVERGHGHDCAKRFTGAAECTCGHADAEAQLEAQGGAGVQTYSLFALVNAADTVFIDSIEAVEVGYGHYVETEAGKDQLRISSAEDCDYHFEDQQVVLMATGEVLAIASPSDPEDESTTYRILLTVDRPLSALDLQSKS